MPEEFAATYRAAYERALAAQSDGPRHREPEPPEGTDADAGTDSAWSADPLPRRRDRLRVGTHRTPEPAARPAPEAPPRPAPARTDDDAPTAYERVRDSPWFVPLLLVLLVLALVLGAYVVGRAFSGQVATKEKPSSQPALVRAFVPPMLAA